MDKRRTITIIKLILLIIIIAGVPAYLYINYRDTLFSSEWLSRLPETLSKYKGHTAAVLFGIQVLQVIISIIPGQPIQFAASYMFGVLRGFLLSIAGAVIGATIAFYIAKLLGKDSLYLVFDKDKVDEYHKRLNSGKGLLAVLIFYLIPGLPKDLVAYVAGITDMRFRPFIIISTIGRSPGMLGSLLLGHFFGKKNITAIIIIAVITIFILIICYIKKNSIIRMLDDLEARDERR